MSSTTELDIMDTFFAVIGASALSVVLAVVVALLGAWILMVTLPLIFTSLVFLSYWQWFVIVFVLKLVFGPGYVRGR